MLNAAEHMAKIIQDLNFFSHRPSGSFERVSLRDVIESTLSFSLRQLTINNIELIKQYEDDLPEILGDKGQLQQVVLNMITNARDAMPNGGKFFIKTNYSIREKRVIMEFIDTGQGIKEDQLLRVFDPFFTTKDSGKGTGLGLSVVHGIVTQHNGEIIIESQMGQGAKFIIKFPKAES